MYALEGQAALSGADAAGGGFGEGLDEVRAAVYGFAEQGEFEAVSAAGRGVSGVAPGDVEDVGARRIAVAAAGVRVRGRRQDGFEEGGVVAVAPDGAGGAVVLAGQAGLPQQGVAQSAPPGGAGVVGEADGVDGLETKAISRKFHTILLVFSFVRGVAVLFT